MPAKVTFTNVELLGFGRSAKGAGLARIQFSFTKDLRKAMGWSTDLPEFQHGADLDGDLAAVTMELNPSQPELKKHAVELSAQRMHKFVVTRQELEGKRGKGFRWTVQADIAFSDPQGCQKLERFKISVPKFDLRVYYEPKAVQEVLPDAGDESQASLEVN